jgi:hypothetical protein
MASNQNPVFVDGKTITGDGTERHPLESAGGGGSPGGAVGDIQFNNGASGFTNAPGISPGAVANLDVFGDLVIDGGGSCGFSFDSDIDFTSTFGNLNFIADGGQMSFDAGTSFAMVSGLAGGAGDITLDSTNGTGKINLTSAAEIDLHCGPGGNLIVHAGSILLNGNSIVPSVNGQFGAITIQSSGATVTITNPSPGVINLETAGGGGGSPGGASGDVQFNSSGAFNNLASLLGGAVFQYAGGVLHISGIGFSFGGGVVGQAVITSSVQTQIDAFAGAPIIIGTAGNGPIRIASASGSLGFFGSAAQPQATVTGSRSTSAAITSLLSILNTMGLIVDGSTP